MPPEFDLWIVTNLLLHYVTVHRNQTTSPLHWSIGGDANL